MRLDDKFFQIISAITEGKVNAVSVIDDKGIFCGLITGYDIRQVLQCSGKLKEITAEQVMTPDPVTISKDVYAVEAFKIMKNNPRPLLLLPVLDNKKAAGIITIQDMVRAGL